MTQARHLDSKPISLFGFETHSVTVTMPAARHDYAILGDNWKYRLNRPEPIQFEAEFMLGGLEARHLRTTAMQLYSRCGFTISRLGDTQICQCCNYQMRPGTSTCHRCGSPYTAVVEKSKYDRVGRGYVTSIELSDNSLFDDRACSPIRMTFEMDDLTIIDSDIRSTLSGWCTTHLEDGWICWYCKSVNSLDKTECHYCGGGRLPFSDLERIAQKCLYCGTKLTKGAVCTGCGSAQNGYSVWPPRYDW